MSVQLHSRIPSTSGVPLLAGVSSAAGTSPARRRAATAVVQCIVDELAAVVGEGACREGGWRGRHRRSAIHRRQIAMYVAHVVLRLSLTDIGCAFGRDRTTVGHACNVVEDRRDDPAYDRFVTGVERIVAHIFPAQGVADA